MSIKSLRIALAGVACGAAALLVGGCSDAKPAASPAGTAQATDAAGAKPADESVERETWDLYRMQGARVGYGRTTFHRAAGPDRATVKIEGLIHLSIQRSGQTTEQDIRCTSTETPEGQLLGFESEIQQGPEPLRVTGRVQGNRLDIEMSTAGKRVPSSIAWSPEYGGPYAVEASLARRPMKPGEKRTIHALDITVNQVVETELAAQDFESVPLLAGTFRLLHIDTVVRLLDGQKIRGVTWTDGAGETLKSRVEMMNMEVLRVPKTVALAKTEAAKFDLWEESIVKVDRPLPRAHDTKRVRYRVRVEGGDPATLFPSGLSQKVTRIDDHTAEITVYALRPDVPGNPDAPDDPPTDADRQPNNFIQSDDAKIVADAREAAGRETDPWRVATALERYVHSAVKVKDFTQAFATAAEVARDREGDCTEHAVYLAALARACGIPARVAVGLVYMEKDQAFGYHMWTEVYVNKRWIPIDGTLARGGIGAAHLQVAHSSMQGASAYSSFLPVVQLMGRIKIEVLDSD